VCFFPSLVGKRSNGARIKQNGSQTILFLIVSIIGGSALFCRQVHFSAHLLIDDLLFCEEKPGLRAQERGKTFLAYH
jgi:hypothetical protein